MPLDPEQYKWLAGLDPKTPDGMAAMTLLKAPPEAASSLVPPKGTMPLGPGTAKPLPTIPASVAATWDAPMTPTEAPTITPPDSIDTPTFPSLNYSAVPEMPAQEVSPSMPNVPTVFGIPKTTLANYSRVLAAIGQGLSMPGTAGARVGESLTNYWDQRDKMALAQSREAREAQEGVDRSELAKLQIALHTKQLEQEGKLDEPIGSNPWGLPENYTPRQLKAIPAGVMSPKETGPISVAPGHVLIDRKTGQPVYTAPMTPKPVNMPPWYDALGVSQMGQRYNTPEGQAQFADWVAKPENQAQIKTFQQEYAKNTSSPVITYLQTSEGFVPAQTRGPEVGKVGAPTGFGAKLPSEMVTANQQIGTLKETMAAVKAGYNPDYVGPIAGRTGALAEKTIGISPERAMFNAQVAQLQNSLIYLMSGKQINESEYVRLKKQIPDINLPARVFEARMKEFDRTVDSIIANREKNMGGYGNQRKPASQFTPLDVTITKEDAIAELRRRGKIK